MTHPRHPPDRERRRPRGRAAPRLGDVAPGAVPATGPHIERKGLAGMRHVGGGTYELEFDDDAPQADCWVFDGSGAPAQASRRRRRLRPRRHDAVADHLRRDAPGLLRAQGPRRRHAHEPRRGVGVASRRSRASAVRRSSRRATATSGWRACSRTTTGWSTSGAATATAHSSRSRSSRCGTSTRGRRGRAERGTWRARRVLQRDPSAPRAPEHPQRLLGSVLRCVRRARVRCACTSARRRRCRRRRSMRRRRRRDAVVRQRDGVDERLPLLGRARALPRAATRVLRGPDRLDPVHPGAGRRRVDGAPRVGRCPRHRARAAVDLLLPPDLRLLLPRPARAVARSTRSASTTSRSRPTTPTPTRRGPTPRRSPRRCSRASTTRRSTRSSAATRSACCTST